MKTAIIGLGYVGQSIAQAAIGAGYSVVGFDTSQDVIASINLNGDFKGTTDAALIGDVDVVIIAVPTPLDDARNPDLSAIHAACKTIIENIKKPVLVINESTSYPGTLRNEIASLIESSSGIGHFYATSPERVNPGDSIWTQKNTPRLVAGLTSEATFLARQFYSSFCDQIIEVSIPEVAEAAKLFENTFRQVNIALVNEFAQICDALRIPTREILNAAATKPFGFMKFQPGPGVGGHCIPVDPSYLAHAAEAVGASAEMIRHANKVNLNVPSYIVSQLIRNFGTLKNKKIVVVGVAYKANVSDTRESPAAAIIEELKKQGASVSWHDPIVKIWNDQESAELKNHDVAIVVTKHDVVKSKDILACASYVFDCTGTVGIN